MVQLLLLCPKRVRKPVLLTALPVTTAPAPFGNASHQFDCEVNAFEKTRIYCKFTGGGDIPLCRY